VAFSVQIVDDGGALPREETRSQESLASGDRLVTRECREPILALVYRDVNELGWLPKQQAGSASDRIPIRSMTNESAAEGRGWNHGECDGGSTRIV
jgi:hypothetical protein